MNTFTTYQAILDKGVICVRFSGPISRFIGHLDNSADISTLFLLMRFVRYFMGITIFLKKLKNIEINYIFCNIQHTAVEEEAMMVLHKVWHSPMSSRNVKKHLSVIMVCQSWKWNLEILEKIHALILLCDTGMNISSVSYFVSTQLDQVNYKSKC